MNIIRTVAKEVGIALDVKAGKEELASRKLGLRSPATLDVTSPDFESGMRLPDTCAADHGGSSPTLRWAAIPPDAESVVLIVEDPDAPFPLPFVHWMLYGLDPRLAAIESNLPPGALVGLNSALEPTFAGAAPPPGHGVHHYHFQVFALDTPLRLEPALGRTALLEQMQGHVVAWGELVGTYSA